MLRVVEPEMLYDLPPTDPRAVRSRADLRRLNSILGHARILSGAFHRHLDQAVFRSRPLCLVDLGAGDGTLLLQVARRTAAIGVTAQVTLLDRQNIVSPETRRAFAALRWPLENVANDVFAWLEEPFPMVDVMVANLFLHHFPEELLTRLFRLAANRTNVFIACEPRRSLSSLTASRLLRLLGCNGITRHDAPVSVRAGFADRELSSLWPGDNLWQSNEQRAGWCSHCFIVKRNG